MRSPPGDVSAGHDHQITTTQMSLFFNVTGSIVQCPHEGTAPSSHLEPPPPVREPNRGSGTPVVLGRPRASWDHGRPRTAQRYWNPDRFWDAGGTGTPPVLERGNGTGTRNWSWNAGVVLERPRCWNAGTVLERETGPGTRGWYWNALGAGTRERYWNAKLVLESRGAVLERQRCWNAPHPAQHSSTGLCYPSP